MCDPISAITAIVSAVTADKSGRARRRQVKQVEKQQAVERATIKEQKAKALGQRKELIDKQRRQLYGSGELGAGSSYSIAQTGATGVPRGETPTLTGAVLG